MAAAEAEDWAAQVVADPGRGSACSGILGVEVALPLSGPLTTQEGIPEAGPAGESAGPLPGRDPDCSENAAGPGEPALAGTLLGLQARLETLERAVSEGNRLSQDRERIIDRLHEENRKLRAGELQQALMPLVRDAIRLYDDIGRTVQDFEERAGQVALAAAVRALADYRDCVADLLFRQGIEQYQVREGAPFDAGEQKPLRAVDTSNPACDRTVARVFRAGFRAQARVVRPAEVEVFRLVTIATGAESGPSSGSDSAAASANPAAVPDAAGGPDPPVGSDTAADPVPAGDHRPPEPEIP